MLNYNEVLPKKLIIHDGEPYEVLSAWVFRKQQRKPVNQTKLRNLKTGSVAEVTFHQPDKIDEAETETKTAVFIFHDPRKGEWNFHEAGDKSNRFSIPDDKMDTASKFLKEGTEVETLWFEGEMIQVRLPIKMELEVKEAPPDVRGNTAQGGNKVVTLETGATIQVPMFIKAGDVVRINTETGEYTERV